MKLRPSALRVAASAAVLAPFGLSVAAHVVPDRPAAPPVSERAALRIGEHLVNLGRMPEGRPAAAVFRFWNTGETPLTIRGFETSCGCLTPRLDDRTYDAGEAGTFVVEADTAGAGSDREDRVKQHFVDVRYDAGDGERTARVHLKFVLPARRVVVEPRSLLVFQPNDEPTTFDITVTDRRTPPVTVTAVECPSPHVTVESRTAESAGDATRATITVTVPKSPGRDVQTLVTVHTDDIEQPVIYVPVVVKVPPPGLGVSPLSLVPKATGRE